MASLISLNVRGLCTWGKTRAVLASFPKNSIICLQETWWDADCVKKVQDLWGGSMAYNNGSATSRGVAMLVGEGAGITWREVFADSNGRVLIVDVCAKLWEGRVIIVYAPNDEVERKTLFTSLAAWVTSNTLMVLQCLSVFR